MSVFTHELDTSCGKYLPPTEIDHIKLAEKYRGDFTGQIGIKLQPEGCNFAVHVGENVASVDFVVHNRHIPDIETERYQLNPAAYSVSGETATAAIGFIPNLEPGDIYSITAHYHTEDGNSHWNPNLLDPYAKSVVQFGQKDSKQPKLFSQVVDAVPRNDRPPRPNLQPGERVIYEAHLKGATMLNTEIPEEIRGTYAGFADPANIRYLKKLGVTTVQLLPIQQNAPEEFLYRKDAVNYWGYSTVGFFAPHDKYAMSPAGADTVEEVKTMVDALHEAGIEVVLDVVYNHTAEGGHGGPVYSFKGLDNSGYYHLNEDDSYRDNTGCGNMMNMSSPVARQLVMDSLRYWVSEIGIDGFRFDLAASLLRNSNGEVDAEHSPFLREINEDPVLNKCLLIAEPWDIGSYPEGQFTGMSEWSGRARDVNRDFHNTGSAKPSDLAATVAGSFSNTQAINIVTAHDGFTLGDLVTYAHKHNLSNGEDNRDGTDDNRSNNHGQEGPSSSNEIRQARLRTAMNLALTNLMSAGTPMITAGDEYLRTQHGNNNSYRHDNETNWIDRANLTPAQIKMLDFMTEAIRIRKESVLGHEDIQMSVLPDSPIDEIGLGWLNQNGSDMSVVDWHGDSRVFGVYSSGLASETVADSILYYMNGSDADQPVSLPKKLAFSGDYLVLAETANGVAKLDGFGLAPGTFILPAKSSIVLKRVSSRTPYSVETTESYIAPSEATQKYRLNLGAYAMKIAQLEKKIAPILSSDFMIPGGETTLQHAA